MKLQKIRTVELRPSAPFRFDPTFHKPDQFTSGDNCWEPGIRWQTWNWSGECLGLKFQNQGTIDEFELRRKDRDTQMKELLKLFFDQDPECPVGVSEILKHFEKFGDYKQLAVHYIWEDLWCQRKTDQIPWLEKLIRI